MSVGRPSEYDPKYCDEVIELGREGKSKAQIAASIGVCRQTLDNWCNAHKEFMDAVNQARELALVWWEDLGQEMVREGTGNATMFIFQTKNRFPDDYRDKREIEATVNTHEDALKALK